jgi:hypothetical protein
MRCRGCGLALDLKSSGGSEKDPGQGFPVAGSKKMQRCQSAMCENSSMRFFQVVTVTREGQRNSSRRWDSVIAQKRGGGGGRNYGPHG